MNKTRIYKPFLEAAGVEIPIIGGPMYPCSNPELVAAVSEAGGLGVIQPLSLTFVYGYKFKEGVRYIRTMTQKPVGFNALIEASSKVYLERMMKYIDEALEEGVRFFVTSLGNPKIVVDKVQAVGGIVYHDVTERKWAMKAIDAGVDGLICVNSTAGGHAGGMGAKDLYESLKDLGIPLICAGGVGSPKEYHDAMKMGYQGVQLGTRFVASKECAASEDYKNAIVKAKASDIVLTEKITGVPVAVIKTKVIEDMGLKSNPVMSFLLRHHKTKHWMRSFYSLKSFLHFKKSINRPSYKDIWQAGRSCDSINEIKSVNEIMSEFRATK